MTKKRLAWMAAVIAFAAVIVTFGFVEGNRFSRRQIKIRLGAGPLVGRYEIRFGWRTLPVVLFAALVVWLGPRLARQIRARLLPVATGAATAVFTALLAATDRSKQLLEPVVHPTEYWQILKTAPPLGTFVRTYLDELKGYSVHLRGHPPGYPSLLIIGRSMGITSPWVVAAMSWIAAGVGAAMVIVAVGRVAGTPAARSLAPALVVAPYAVWAGTSADAVYMAVGASGVAAMAIATTGSMSERRRWLWAALSGVLFGLLLFGTYGAVMMTPLAMALVIAQRRWSLLVPALVSVAGIVAGFALAGFWWLDGAHATRVEYWLGTAQFREPWRFAVFNVAALLIALGPAVVVAIGFVRRAPWMWLVGGALAGVVASNASQYSKGEVERIWLIFMPWISVVLLSIVQRRRVLHLVVASQAATAIAIQTVLVSKW